MVTQEPAAAFLTGLADLDVEVVSVGEKSGHQRSDGTEPFGYTDGGRNVARDDRGNVVFVDRDELPEEPGWVQNGTCMAWPGSCRTSSHWLSFRSRSRMPDGPDCAGRRLDLPTRARDEPLVDARVPLAPQRRHG